MSRALLEWQIAELVDDEQFGLREEGELIGELAVELGAGERTEQRGGAGEEHRVASLDGSATESDGEMSLADARRSEEEHVFGLGNEAAGGELADEALVDRWLRLEIELFERLHRREVGDGHAHRDALALLGLHLAAQQAVEEVEIGRLAACCLGEDRVESIGEIGKAQACEILQHAGVDDGAHRAPPPRAAWWSARLRPRASSAPGASASGGCDGSRQRPR